MERSATSGFTLIELIVVCAIVVILAALIVPTFVNASDGGRRSMCLSNMRQVGMAILQYDADSDGIFPAGRNLDQDWVPQIYPYLGSTEILRCPDDDTQLGSPHPGLFVQSYAINSTLLGNYFAPINGPPVSKIAMSEKELISSSKTALLFEITQDVNQLRPVAKPTQWWDGPLSPSGDGADTCGDYDVDGKVFFAPCGQPPNDIIENFKGHQLYCSLYATGDIGGRKLNGPFGPLIRHVGGANYVACDGHAIWLRPEDVSGGRNADISTCPQGNSADVSSGCHASRIWYQNAAGTENAGYKLTFSGR